MSEQASCQACGAPLVWAITAGGSRAPLCAAPSDDGNVLVFRHQGELRCVTPSAAVLEWLREAKVPLRLNHFANCPERERFKT